MGRINFFGDKNIVYEIRDSVLGNKRLKDEPTSLDSFTILLSRNLDSFGVVNETGQGQALEFSDTLGIPLLNKIFSEQVNPDTQFVIISIADDGTETDEYVFQLLFNEYSLNSTIGSLDNSIVEETAAITGRIERIEDDFISHKNTKVDISGTTTVRNNSVSAITKTEALLFSQIVPKVNKSQVAGRLPVAKVVDSSLDAFDKVFFFINNNAFRTLTDSENTISSYFTLNNIIANNIKDYFDIPENFLSVEKSSNTNFFNIFNIQENTTTLTASVKFYIEACIVRSDGVSYVNVDPYKTPLADNEITFNLVLTDSEDTVKEEFNYVNGTDSEVTYVGDVNPDSDVFSSDTYAAYYLDASETFSDISIGDKIYLYVDTNISNVSDTIREVTFILPENAIYTTEWIFTQNTLAPETTSNFVEIDDAINAVVNRISDNSATVTIDKTVNWDSDLKLMSGFDIRGVSDAPFKLSFSEIMNSLKAIWAYGYSITSDNNLYIAHVTKFFDSANAIDISAYPTSLYKEDYNGYYAKTFVKYGWKNYAKNTISSEDEQAEGGQLGFQTEFERNTPLLRSTNDTYEAMCDFPADGFLIEFQRRKNELFKEDQSASEDDLTFLVNVDENTSFVTQGMSFANTNIKEINYFKEEDETSATLTIYDGRLEGVFEAGDVITVNFYVDNTGLILDFTISMSISDVGVNDNDFTTTLTGTQTSGNTTAYDNTGVYVVVFKDSGSTHYYPPINTLSTNLVNPQTTYNLSLTPNSIFENNSYLFQIPLAATTDRYEFLNGINNINAEISGDAQNQDYTVDDLNSPIFGKKRYTLTKQLPFALIERLRNSAYGTGSEPYYYIQDLNNKGETIEGYLVEMQYSLSKAEATLTLFEKG